MGWFRSISSLDRWKWSSVFVLNMDSDETWLCNQEDWLNNSSVKKVFGLVRNHHQLPLNSKMHSSFAQRNIEPTILISTKSRVGFKWNCVCWSTSIWISWRHERRCVSFHSITYMLLKKYKIVTLDNRIIQAWRQKSPSAQHSKPTYIFIQCIITLNG